MDPEFIIDLDDTLAETYKLKDDVSRSSEITLMPDADIFIRRYGKQSTLVTVGTTEWQRLKLSVLGIADSFKDVRILKSSQDKLDAFRDIIGNSDPKNYWVIGDRPDVEIRAGYMLKIPTIRLRIVAGKHFNMDPRNITEHATHTFFSFKELLDFFERNT